MDRRTKICIWVILIGLANFLAYTIIYMYIGGEAINGCVQDMGKSAGVHQYRYVLQSQQTVSKGMFIYSGIHSISVWVTVAAIMLAMLTLAKERIVSAMHSTIVRGRTFITILATIITFTTAIMTIWFVLQFIREINNPRPVSLTSTTALRATSPEKTPSSQ